MIPKLTKGYAFLVPSGPQAQLHLHIILTDECKDGQHLVVSVSSVEGKGWHDKTCLLKAGDHKAITKPSFIFYRMAGRMNARHIEKMIEKKYFKEQPATSEELLKAVCDGVCKSAHTPRGSKKYYQENSD